MNQMTNRERQPSGADLSALFREGMSHVAAGVHVLATDGLDGRAGLTATAVASVSDAPPTLLVCVKASGGFASCIRGNGVFSVNVLQADHLDVAEAFAGRTGLRGDARFDVGAWESGAEGVPVLAGALSRFICRVRDIQPVATHLVVIGEVLQVHAGMPGQALVYKDRAYHRF